MWLEQCRSPASLCSPYTTAAAAIEFLVHQHIGHKPPSASATDPNARPQAALRTSNLNDGLASNRLKPD